MVVEEDYWVYQVVWIDGINECLLTSTEVLVVVFFTIVVDAVNVLINWGLGIWEDTELVMDVMVNMGV